MKLRQYIRSLLNEGWEGADTEIKIKPTSEWMQKWYGIINDKLFGGVLGDCYLAPFTTGRGSQGGTLGFFGWQVSVYVVYSDRHMFVKDSNGNEITVTHDNFVSLCHPKIILNGNYSATEETWLNTLIHEMCHYYTYMNGYSPKQAHGKEFRAIGKIVESRSNGKFKIETFATAEEMRNMELDDDIKAKQNAKIERLKSNMGFAILKNPYESTHLISYRVTKYNVIGCILHDYCGGIEPEYLGCCSNRELVERLYNMGMNNYNRSGRYWLKDPSTIPFITDYKWVKITGNKSLEEVLGIEPKQSEEPQSEEPQAQETPVANINDIGDTSHAEEENATPNAEPSLLDRYKRFKDGNGYNIWDTVKNHKLFGEPMDDVSYNKQTNELMFTKGRFTFIGFPGKWRRANLQENIDKQLKQALRESLRKYVVDEMKGENDVVEITPDMNLSEFSPLEMV